MEFNGSSGSPLTALAVERDDSLVAGTRRLRILLVDDEADMLLLLQAMLSNSHWEVLGKALTAEDALRMAPELEPDVAVVDYMMPGMHGFDLAGELKALHPNCTVIIFSAFDVEQEARAHPHVDQFLSKTKIGRLEQLLLDLGLEKGLFD